jgi:hypothetical protein
MPGQGANAGDSDQGFEFIQKAGVILFGVLVWAGHRVASNINGMMNDESSAVASPLVIRNS